MIQFLFVATKVILTYLPSSERVKQFQVFAIDDIMVRPGRCQHRFDYIYTFNNNFEDLEFEAIQPLTGSIGFIISPQYKPLPGVPLVDHSTNTEKGRYFLFMNMYQFVATTYISTITIADLPADKSDTCLRFAYQMKGNVTFKVVLAEDYNYINDYSNVAPLWRAVT